MLIEMKPVFFVTGVLYSPPPGEGVWWSSTGAAGQQTGQGRPETSDGLGGAGARKGAARLNIQMKLCSDFTSSPELGGLCSNTRRCFMSAVPKLGATLRKSWWSSPGMTSHLSDCWNQSLQHLMDWNLWMTCFYFGIPTVDPKDFFFFSFCSEMFFSSSQHFSVPARSTVWGCPFTDGGHWKKPLLCMKNRWWRWWWRAWWVVWCNSWVTFHPGSTAIFWLHKSLLCIVMCNQ